MSVARAIAVERGPLAVEPEDHVLLDYDARLVRRKKLVSLGGVTFWADLPEAVSLGHGDALVLEDGRRFAVDAAPEPLLAITGDLARLAWHIGNRHTPCQIEANRLLIRVDPVLEQMLGGLGAEVTPVTERFQPDGGAYGHGRVMGHSHSGPNDAPHRDDTDDGDDA